MYAIGADVAEGSKVDDDHDYDVASVIRCDTLEEVAQLRGQWSTADYAILLSQLGYYYNFALLAVERNNHGHSVLNTLQNGRPGFEKWVYPLREPGRGGLYYVEPEQDERNSFAARLRRAGRSGVAMNKKAGWDTNIRTRPLMLDYLANAILAESIGLNSRITVSELMSFVKGKNGKPGGDGASHDDAVIALSIALFVAQTVDRYTGGTGTLDATGFTALGGNRGGSDTMIGRLYG